MTDIPGWGHLAWDIFWRPVAAWSLVALALYPVLAFVRSRDWALLADLRTAVVGALPLAILLSPLLPGIPRAVVPSTGGSSIDGSLAVSLPETVLTETAGTIPAAAIDWMGWCLLGLTAVAVVITAIGFFRLGLGFVGVRRLVDRATPDRQASAESGHLVLISPEASTPFSFRLGQSGIVLPAGFPYPEIAIRHEAEHIVSGDLTRSWILALLRASFYFHPLVHLLTSRAQALLELACDARVIRSNAIAPHIYGAALMAASSDWRYPVAGVAMAGGPQLRERIAQLEGPHLASSRRTAVGAGSALLLLVSLGAGCLGADAPLADALAQRLSLPVSTSREAFRITDQVPEIPGGIAALQAKVQYPSAECPARYAGVIVVAFHLNPDGFATDPNVIQGISPGCDAEAVRVVKTTRLLPGVVQGRRVWTRMSLPVKFYPTRPDSMEAGPRDLRRALEPRDESWPVDFYSTPLQVRRPFFVLFSGTAPLNDRGSLAGIARIQGADGVIVGRTEDMGIGFSHRADSVLLGIVYTDHPFESWIRLVATRSSGRAMRDAKVISAWPHDRLEYLLPEGVSITVESEDGSRAVQKIPSEHNQAFLSATGNLTVVVGSGDETLVQLQHVGRIQVTRESERGPVPGT